MNAALILAAGRGHRLGGPAPKQYLPLAGKALLAHSLAAFARHRAVDGVRVVIHPDDRPLYDQAAAGLDLLPPVPGGATRQESARLGLESLVELAPSKVLIHDGARPFPDPALIDRTLAALEAAPAAIPALPVSDTLKRGRDGRIAETVDRADLWRAQTPQGFRFEDILAAHRASAGEELTDDAAVAERGGLAVALVEGSEDNVKVTTPEDLRRAERSLAAETGEVRGEVRVGSGFDVHRFAAGDHVMLCGVAVPHPRGLAGHSDADVGLHALTDAVLGALGAGDIGEHFPPSDPRWAGAPSDQFLSHAAALAREAGGRILHVDVTLICEQPRIGPQRAAMRARVAAILGLAESRVSVKGKTTEGLGFTGRGEGIAAQATATLRLPEGP
jgi:2-C-methyl-D-erythritol 4-phosphate cytidylyltransferase/2-C-methyl-D-erythritol 2,4-cyclodiphosphate synthase